MAWTMQGSIKGPQGDPGPAGADGAPGAAGAKGDTGAQGIQGIQGIQGDVGPTGSQGVPGDDGRDGAGVDIAGSVANAAALPTNLGPDDVGTAYITADDGHLHVWDGAAFNDVGTIVGPRGATGATGADGATGPAGARGTKWFQGTGAPGTISGSLPGDFYLDFSDGTVYVLS